MKTTKKHFEMFQKECEKWIKRFGLLGWRFYYQHGDIEGRQIAYCIFPDQLSDRVFTIGLSKNLEMDYSLLDVKRAAFHEILEALLFRIRHLAGCRWGVLQEEIDEEIHNLIRTLEKALFDLVKIRKY